MYTTLLPPSSKAFHTPSPTQVQHLQSQPDPIRSFSTVQITPQLYNPTSVSYQAPETKKTNVLRNGPVQKDFQNKIVENIQKQLVLQNPFARPNLYDGFYESTRFIFSNSLFGDSKLTTHYIADRFIPHNVHWGVDSEINGLGSKIKLFNMEYGVQPTWHQYLEEGLAWISKFPGQLHYPTEQLTFDMLFELKKDESNSLTPLDLVELFSGVNPGLTDITIPPSVLNSLLKTEEISGQTKIVPHMIELVEVHSNLPVPVHIQLRTTSMHDKKAEWLNCHTINAKDLLGPVIYPNTHSKERELYFEFSDVVREAMFFRWINTDLNSILSQLAVYKRGDNFYHIPTPNIVEDHPNVYNVKLSTTVDEDGTKYLPSSQMEPALNVNGREADLVDYQQKEKSIYQVQNDALHASNLISFIALDEWHRLVKIHEYERKPESIRIDLENKQFIVDSKLFEFIITEKFTGAMDPSLHVMRTDNNMDLRVSLMNQSLIGKKQLVETLNYLHPGLDIPSINVNTSNHQMNQSSIGKKTTNAGPPCYNFSVRLRVKCARLESGIVSSKFGLREV